MLLSIVIVIFCLSLLHDAQDLANRMVETETLSVVFFLFCLSPSRPSVSAHGASAIRSAGAALRCCFFLRPVFARQPMAAIAAALVPSGHCCGRVQCSAAQTP